MSDPRTRPRQLPERVSDDFEAACAILDQALVAHVGFCDGDQPYVLPMASARVGHDLILHGAVAGRLLTRLAEGVEVCVGVTLLDGLVLSRAAFGHSMNYRSVMLFGRAVEVTDPGTKAQLAHALVEHIVPGRMADTRPPDDRELAATRLLRLPIETFSVKQRSGPPQDAAKDMASTTWCGEIPLHQVAGDPVPDPAMPGDPAVPAYAKRYRR
jgi:nitroimidazol reductase NimA-like FMN-containing flavoprotein (pyridoxamine 5'-phosphate oxidase superfamily)